MWLRGLETFLEFPSKKLDKLKKMCYNYCAMHNKMRLIKRYKNRRLYDTDTKSAVTLSDVARLIRDKKEFKVIESDTGEDITGATVIQVLLNVEKRAREVGRMVTSIGKATGKKTEEIISVLMEHIRSILKVMDKSPDSETVNSKQ
ncbi:hypothetical protein CH333_04300 [candidate division WOR-3 bacterium JGI_Cruoil_03_44_89]|uniref:PHA accumulation regulator DNA-binding N-terminal domain-containing protein n=1 Tax=candidate division WOR-3 bacterium JGI_Cruoil_03_44_89 TaxID=1973748 RepID=A0A235BWD8_UNCW3|nr:MAG: hypothetical protein CH333_04300 [candidate division WOR-3 bacterium JGI_Cruoil_03_44_89]